MLPGEPLLLTKAPETRLSDSARLPIEAGVPQGATTATRPTEGREFVLLLGEHGGLGGVELVERALDARPNSPLTSPL